MKALYRFQVLDQERKELEQVSMDMPVTPPEGYELRDWKVDSYGSIVVCWRLTVYEQNR